jgi:Rrf2 family transcriptional regulator, cysteine metabolism repressor
MQISTKSRYGLRAILELARQKSDKPLSTKEISIQQKITIPYLEQLFFKLKHKGFVRSVRGAQGGYFLAREASEITVGDIIECLDGPIEFTDCKSFNDVNSTCIGPDNCLAYAFWEDLKQLINKRLFSTTLADLLANAQKRIELKKQDIETEA